MKTGSFLAQSATHGPLWKKSEPTRPTETPRSSLAPRVFIAPRASSVAPAAGLLPDPLLGRFGRSVVVSGGGLRGGRLSLFFGGDVRDGVLGMGAEWRWALDFVVYSRIQSRVG